MSTQEIWNVQYGFTKDGIGRSALGGSCGLPNKLMDVKNSTCKFIFLFFSKRIVFSNYFIFPFLMQVADG